MCAFRWLAEGLYTDCSLQLKDSKIYKGAGNHDNLVLRLIYPRAASMICHSLDPTPECFPRTLKPTDSNKFCI